MFDIETINLIICQKNKNRKIYFIKHKNRLYTAKLCYNKLNVADLDIQFKRINKNRLGLFPEYVFKNNYLFLYHLSNNLSQKINSHISSYRSANNCVLVENIAQICADAIFDNFEIDILKFININFDINRLYKKELTILPSLIVLMLIKKLIDLYDNLVFIDQEIKLGGVSNKIKKNKKYSNAFYYGVVKYNKNLLRFANISSNQYKKCVFEFIEELNDIEYKAKVIVSYIEYFVHRFSV